MMPDSEQKGRPSRPRMVVAHPGERPASLPVRWRRRPRSVQVQRIDVVEADEGNPAGVMPVLNPRTPPRGFATSIRMTAGRSGARSGLPRVRAVRSGIPLTSLRVSARTGVTPHVAQVEQRKSAVDGRTTRHAGYGILLIRRRLIEGCFGWIKTIGNFRRTRFRAVPKTNLVANLTAAAYNLIRMTHLDATHGDRIVMKASRAEPSSADLGVTSERSDWIPAFAGMTDEENCHLLCGFVANGRSSAPC